MAGKGKSKAKLALVEIVSPTNEQMRDGAFMVEPVHDRTPAGGLNLKGTAYRRRPMIDVLAEQGLFTESEYKALRHYRHHADIADRSLVKDSLGKRQGHSSGSRDGPTVATLNAIRLVADVEAAAGQLRGILRAVVVYDQSLSQWAMAQAGAKEQCRDRKGRTVCTLEPRRKALDIAKLEIRFAAQRVEAELAA